jgi:hypothetical protein
MPEKQPISVLNAIYYLKKLNAKNLLKRLTRLLARRHTACIVPRMPSIRCLLASDYVQADEMPIKCQDPDQTGLGTFQGYFWVVTRPGEHVCLAGSCATLRRVASISAFHYEPKV